ncbi:glycoside hydrolase family 5 protein [Saccharophagus degradans]|uniref:glycoside hydrolase family 5 protein n=1 Tax=Saccharophagus degradans TaxID=86304 RepID=UPI001C08B19F|nr:glycoside hydrolase family 5 protein [Saccharophagus degradans]MBU2985120.1 glycoside hydrolase family 5 protein [Saccharophagus degradans]
MTIKRWPFDRKGPSKKPNAKKILAGLAAALSLTAMQSTAAVEPLQTSGNQILVGNQAKALGGHSLFWHNVPAAGSLYNADTVSRLKNDWNSKVIRAAIGIEVPFNSENTYIGNKGSSLAAIDRVVNAAVANDMYVIIDFHTHHAEDNIGEAITFFSEMAQLYGHHDNVIFEIYNEPLNTTSWGTIKHYAEQVIRAHSDNLIVVGTRTWSQNVDEAAFDKINDSNTTHALHFYVGSHDNHVRNLAQTALNNGAAIFASEWGIWPNNNYDGMNADDWMNFLDQKKSLGLTGLYPTK